MAKRAPPVNFAPKLAARIIEELAAGRSLAEVCADVGMPDLRSVRRWIADRPDFRASYDRARVWWAYSIAEEINDLVATAPQVVADAAAKNVNENAAITALKVQIDTKKWL